MALVSSRAYRLFPLASCAVALWSAPLHAEDAAPFVVTDWRAPADVDAACRDSARFEALVRERLGESPAHEGTLPVAIAIDRHAGELRLLLRTGGEAGGQRELVGADCESLVATAALVLSLALLPDYFQNERQEEVVTEQSLARGVQLGDDETPRSLWRRAPARGFMDSLADEPLDVGVDLVTLSDLGTLPQPALGLGIQVHAQAADYQLGFRLSRWMEQKAFVEALEPGRGGRFDYLAGTLQLCKRSKAAIGLCAQTTLGRLSAEAIGVEQPRTQVNVLAAGALALFWQHAVGTRSHLRVQGELGAHLRRPLYTILVRPPDGSLERVVREIHQPSILHAGLSVGWGLDF